MGWTLRAGLNLPLGSLSVIQSLIPQVFPISFGQIFFLIFQEASVSQPQFLQWKFPCSWQPGGPAARHAENCKLCIFISKKINSRIFPFSSTTGHLKWASVSKDQDGI